MTTFNYEAGCENVIYKIRMVFVCLVGLGSFAGLNGCVSSKLDFDNDPKLALSKGVLSSDFGTGLEKSNRLKAVQAERKALESGITGAPIAWVGSNEAKGSVTPGQPYQVGSATCRTYTHSIVIAGQTKSAKGTACKDKNADWVPLS